jgi:cyclopropane fatty-acyl-phospholipid synthase-like methyltransferase
MLRFIGNQFRKPTGFFGKIISRVMAKGNSAAYDKIIRELDIKPHDRILEIGYGPGIGVERIASAYDCFVAGIDFSELMFMEASRRNKKHIERKKVELHHGDFLRWDPGTGRFDRIFCTNVIYFWNNLDKPFEKIYQGLNAGGMICIFMVHQADLDKFKFTKDGIFNRYSIEQVAGCLTLAGFRDVGYTFDKGYIIKGRK